MVALTEARTLRAREPKFRRLPIKAGVTLHDGALAVLENGEVTPGKVGTGLVTLGVVRATYHDETVKVERGCFPFNKSGPVEISDIGKTAYVVDDQTVSVGADGGTRSVAGIIFDVDVNGVWVEV